MLTPVQGPDLILQPASLFLQAACLNLLTTSPLFIHLCSMCARAWTGYLHYINSEFI